MGLPAYGTDGIGVSAEFQYTNLLDMFELLFPGIVDFQ